MHTASNLFCYYNNTVSNLSGYLRARWPDLRVLFHFGVFLFVAITLQLAANSALAASLYWNAASGDWSDPMNWGSTEPTSTDNAYINNGGIASITQSDETCNTLYLGISGTGTTGTIQMTGGTLSSNAVYVGNTGTGTFEQSGGVNTVGISLFVGYNSGASGTYKLSGAAQLIAASEYIGGSSGTGVFLQSGGANITDSLQIDWKAQYQLTDGSLQVNKYLDNNGTMIFAGGSLQVSGGFSNRKILDFGGSSSAINASNLIVNFSTASSELRNSQNASLNIRGEDSLLIVPVGFDPQTVFAHYSNEGRTHIAGTLLSIASGQRIAGRGTIADPVDCQGVLSGNSIHLMSGVSISNGGNVDLGYGELHVCDTTSGLYGGSLTAWSNRVGDFKTGVFTHSAGRCTLTGGLTVGAGSSGTYNLCGTGELIAPFESIGNSFPGSVGIFNHSAGVNKIAATLEIRSDSGTGYNLSGTGEVIANTVFINGLGVFDQTGGMNTISQLLQFEGRYRLAGGRLTVGSQGISASYGSGRFEWFAEDLTASAFYAGGSLAMGFDFSVESLVNGSLYHGSAISGLDSSTLEITNACTATQAGSSNVKVSNLLVGTDQGNGTYVFSGTGKLTALYEYVGHSSTGVLNQSQGTNTVNGYLYLGYNSGANGTYNLSDQGKLTTSTQYVGYSGTGTFNQSSGTNTASRILLGYNSNSSGIYNLIGGTLTTRSIDSYHGSAVFNFGGGTLIFNSSGGGVSVPITLTGIGGDATISSIYDVSFNKQVSGLGGLNKLNTGNLLLYSENTFSGDTRIRGGTIKLYNSSALQNSTLDYNSYGGSLNFGTLNSATIGGIKGNQNLALVNSNSAAIALSLGNNDQSTLYSGVFSGKGSLNKTGGGSLTLTGANTYSGGTQVSEGCLLVNNTAGSGTGSGDVAVNSGGTLSGVGYISGAITVNEGGTLSPGSGLGILAINNQITFQPGSFFSSDVNGLMAGTDYDRLKTTGPITLAGSINLSFRDFTPTGHDVLLLIENTGLGVTTGTFQYPDNAKIGTFNGFDWYITYDADNLTTPSLNGGNDVAIYSVPEPSSIVILAIGIAGILSISMLRRETIKH